MARTTPSWVSIGPKDPKSRLAAVVAGVVLFIFFAVAIAGLARQALEQLRLLDTANSDNLQWTLSQTEVEFLQFHNALLQAQMQPDADLANLRRWFDIFVSRMSVVKKGQIYGTLATEPYMLDKFDNIQEFLAEVLPYIDGPDDQLRAHFPEIAAKTVLLRSDVRAISLEGLRVFSSKSDSQRSTVSETMARIALLTASLILLLLLAVFFLTRIYRTARAQAAENLATRERLQAMLNTSLDAVLVVDREGRFVEFNGAASEIFGYSEAEALGAQMTDLIIPDHLIGAHNAGMQRHLETGVQRIIGAGRVQVQAKRKSGAQFPVELSIAKTMSPQGEIFVSYLRDISERKQSEERLTKARDEALAGERAKARFMAVMSHEMRTPLNGLLGSLDLLKGTKLSPKQSEFAEVMQKSGELLLHHVNDVLDIARLESGHRVGDHMPLDLDVLVQEVLESQMALAQAKGLHLAYRPELGAMGMIMGSSIGLRQVLLNLVNNAIKFTEGGSVEVQASVVETDTTPRLSLRVRDTGMGIAASDQARVFEDFVTLDSSFGRRADGTGLGLGIARRIVQSMGGKIGVVSQPKLGSTFWIDLPYEKAAPSQTAAPLSSAPPLPATGAKTSQNAQKPRKVKNTCHEILVVEDNQINRFILREMLAAEGHSVTEAVDGLEGVKLAQERRFDVIFMDISMPTLDGIAATVRLRAGAGPCAQVPIVALTAHALPDDRALFLAAGMNAVLNKPLDRAMLMHMLAELTLAPQNGCDAQAKPQRPPKGMGKGNGMETGNVVASAPSAKATAQPLGFAGLPILRSAVLDDLGSVLGQSRLAGLIDSFIAEGERTLPASYDELSAGRGAQAQAMLHRLAGAAATFGALALQARLAQMETDLKAGDIARASDAHGQLAQLWAKTKAELAAR